jgi:circadian clock protein KaiC
MSNASTELRVATGVAGLDEVLGGGLPEHRLYLVQGDPGTGKTTLALQFLLEGLRLGQPGVYITLSETGDELRQVARSHGWSLDGLTLFELSTDEERVAPDARYTLFHPAEVELQELVRKVLDVVDQAKPGRVAFDSLSELRLVARDPLRYRRQLLALKQFFTGKKATVLLVDDGTSGADDMQLQSLAHGVIYLDQFEPRFGETRRRLRVVKMRGVRFRGGTHDFTIETGGAVVYPRLVAAEHPRDAGTERASSGVPELDALLGGGVHRGTSTLLMGPSGCGKSAIVTQFAVAAAARGERAAIFTFDEVLPTLLDRSRGLGIDLRAHLQTGTLQVRQVDPGELAPGQFVHAVVRAVEQDGARIIAIDSLNGYLNAALDERSLQVQLHELLSYLAQKQIATLLTVGQQGFLGDNLKSSLEISYLADTVLLLRYFEAAGHVRKAVSVMKQRRGAHETAIRELLLGEGGVRIGEPLTDFHGVLTGAPTYVGAKEALLDHAGKPDT